MNCKCWKSIAANNGEFSKECDRKLQNGEFCLNIRKNFLMSLGNGKRMRGKRAISLFDQGIYVPHQPTVNNFHPAALLVEMKDFNVKIQECPGCHQTVRRLLCLSHVFESSAYTVIFSFYFSHIMKINDSKLREFSAPLAIGGQLLPSLESVPRLCCPPLFVMSRRSSALCIVFLSGTQLWIITFILVCFPQFYHFSVFFHLVYLLLSSRQRQSFKMG